MTITETIYTPAWFTLEHTGPDGHLWLQSFRAEWVFDPLDPLTVRLRVPRSGLEMDWEFARSLLYDVFEVDYTGFGDVTLGRFGNDIVISLSSPDGHATITGDSRVAYAFLMETYAVCPPCLGPNHPTHQWCGECDVMDVVVDGALGRIKRESMTGE